MKQRKIFTVVLAVVLLCSFASIAYSHDKGCSHDKEHPWAKSLTQWKLRNDINDNKMSIDALEEAVNKLNSLYSMVEGLQIQIDELQLKIDEIMAMLEPEPGELTLEGTWVNPVYNESPDFNGKVVFVDNGDGTFTEHLYSTTSDTDPLFTTTIYVAFQETDPDGNLFIIWYADYFDTTAFILCKLHADNSVIEANFAYDGYPTEIDSTVEAYNIYNRQE